MLLSSLAVAAGFAACSICSMAPAQPGDGSKRAEREGTPHQPSLADFLEGDREVVAAMLRAAPEKFPAPDFLIPRSRAVTSLLTGRVQYARDGFVCLECLSAAPELDIATGDSCALYGCSEWTRKEFGVAARSVAVGEVRTFAVHGSGFGDGLWKRLLLFAGPAR
ncbi:MAG: hypothetical protein IPK26_27925 [Planctomycetes bacterium]|nr:hypothetical protein [Planctomycetota bacterium]